MKIKSERGFTLIELIIVIVIIGILAAVAVPKFMDLSSSAQLSACKQNQMSLTSACTIYYANDAVTNPTSPSWPADDDALLAAGLIDALCVCPITSAEYVFTNGVVTCATAAHN